MLSISVMVEPGCPGCAGAEQAFRCFFESNKQNSTRKKERYIAVCASDKTGNVAVVAVECKL